MKTSTIESVEGNLSISTKASTTLGDRKLRYIGNDESSNTLEVVLSFNQGLAYIKFNNVDVDDTDRTNAYEITFKELIGIEPTDLSKSINYVYDGYVDLN